MGELILESLHVEGYRGLRDLTIERLGRVNLIVGKNNAGKSSLLEALAIYASLANPDVLRRILNTRDEMNGDGADEARGILPVHRFFSRSDGESGKDRSAKIGRAGDPSRVLTLRLGLQLAELLAQTAPDQPGADIMGQIRTDIVDLQNVLVVRMGDGPVIAVPMDRTASRYWSLWAQVLARAHGRSVPRPLSWALVRSGGLSDDEMREFWTRTVLTPAEDEVTKALQIIAAGVERLALLPDHNRQRVVVLRTGMHAPVPLRTMGDGMIRVFGIILGLVNCAGGILLVDEIENGLHYSIQGDLWRLILRVARDQSVQVFATTHSWDCVEAFQAATAAEEDTQGMLVRIEKRGDTLRAVLFDENRLAVATAEDIEVR